MPVQISAPLPSKSDIYVVSSGTAVSTAGAGTEQAGNFTIPALSNGDTLVIECFVGKSAGSISTWNVYIDNATGALSGGQITIATGSTVCNSVTRTDIARSPLTATKIICLNSAVVTSTLTTTGTYDNALFDVSASEQIFIKTASTTGTTGAFTVEWIAYVIKSGVKS